MIPYLRHICRIITGALKWVSALISILFGSILFQFRAQKWTNLGLSIFIFGKTNTDNFLCSLIKDVIYLSSPAVLLQTPGTFRLVHNSLSDMQLHIEVPHEIPDTLYIYLKQYKTDR